jgi:hypothetical protein
MEITKPKKTLVISKKKTTSSIVTNTKEKGDIYETRI